MTNNTYVRICCRYTSICVARPPCWLAAAGHGRLDIKDIGKAAEASATSGSRLGEESFPLREQSELRVVRERPPFSEPFPWLRQR